MQLWNRRFTKNGVRVLLGLGLAAASALAQAAAPAPIYECPGCSASGMQNVARSVVRTKYPSPRPGDGDYVTVYDLGVNKIATYWVGWYESVSGAPGEPSRYKWQVSAATTPSAVASAFSKLHSIYVQNGRSLILNFSEGGSGAHGAREWRVPAPPAVSAPSNDGGGCWEVRGTPNAYDAAVSSAVRNDIRDYLTDHIETNHVLGQYLWEVLAAIRIFKSPYHDAYDVPLVFDYRFLDGGTIAYRYNWNSRRLEHIDKTIEDCEGNTVPEKKEDIDGAQFRIRSSYSREIFSGYIGGFGGTVSFSGSMPWKCSGGTTSDGRVYVTCNQY
ncbi:hypothetical protein QFW77_17030 [Luteimonas sp. RD2P54]|uniref:Uncharacterized protein n=1 Tax=Luteimonas endophytica TaxID=3042023 RepID=A0ABT6JDG3_9GAMM|nr:hypothetical protein [Luteimonas endophytica]MDH5824677.1 hypothetical protein [Luteimonas endophytica]